MLTSDTIFVFGKFILNSLKSSSSSSSVSIAERAKKTLRTTQQTILGVKMGKIKIENFLSLSLVLIGKLFSSLTHFVLSHVVYIESVSLVCIVLFFRSGILFSILFIFHPIVFFMRSKFYFT